VYGRLSIGWLASNFIRIAVIGIHVGIFTLALLPIIRQRVHILAVFAFRTSLA